MITLQRETPPGHTAQLSTIDGVGTGVVGISPAQNQNEPALNPQGHWTDTNNRKIEKVFWGLTVRYVLENGYNFMFASVKISLSFNGQEYILKQSFITNKDKRTMPFLFEWNIQDLWDIPQNFRNHRNTIINYVITLDGFTNIRGTINISEFEVANNFIINGPNFQTTTALIRRIFTQSVHAVVLHRTDSFNVESALNTACDDAGAHLYVEKNGDIYNKTGLNQVASHVGKIQPRNEAYTKKTYLEIHHQEIKKEYPNRYPYNEDSIGIEVVGKAVNEIYEPITDIRQIKAVARLVNFLILHFSLNKDNDIYSHELISYKTEGEGLPVYNAIKPYLI